MAFTWHYLLLPVMLKRCNSLTWDLLEDIIYTTKSWTPVWTSVGNDEREKSHHYGNPWSFHAIKCLNVMTIKTWTHHVSLCVVSKWTSVLDGHQRNIGKRKLLIPVVITTTVCFELWRWEAGMHVLMKRMVKVNVFFFRWHIGGENMWILRQVMHYMRVSRFKSTLCPWINVWTIMNHEHEMWLKTDGPIYKYMYISLVDMWFIPVYSPGAGEGFSSPCVQVWHRWYPPHVVVCLCTLHVSL